MNAQPISGLVRRQKLLGIFGVLASLVDPDSVWRCWSAPAAVGFHVMRALKAHVHNGRLALDEPTDLPEGTVVPLRIDDDDEMGEDERARLHEALRRSIAQAKAGQLIDGEEVIGKLLARG
jgi:hypothetical protein